jgi:transposase-like protein
MIADAGQNSNPIFKTAGDPKSPQEYLCRDCKKQFCRRGDRDNHERR